MAAESFIPAAASLPEAMRRAFAGRTEVAQLDFEGSPTQVWMACARALAIDQAELARKLAPAFGIDAADSLEAIEPAALNQIPFNLCQRHTIIALRIEQGHLVVATSDPTDQDLAERLNFMLGKPMRWALAPPQHIEDAMVTAFAKEAAHNVRSRENDSQTGSRLAIDDNAIVKFARALMDKAVELRASDLHIQPFLGAAIVRVRVDGAMRRLTMLSDAVANMLIRHVKSRAGMESTNTQVPQDGRMSFVSNERDFELRISTLPASRGERLVIRFLAQSQVKRLGAAGFSLAALQTMRRAVARPAGLIVFTGPTGSGKTSTLYGMLAEVNRSDVNIITVENPVEYRIPGISQVEVNEKAGRTFAAAMRSILRQDPDVILIGEIRDAETAEIAAQAAMTGHLVLTTLHTNDALTAIPRLLNLGVQPPVLADALTVVAAQRLCRVLCAKCKSPVVEPLAPEESMFAEFTRNRPAYRAVGCKACDFTGFRGRLPIVDIVEMNGKLRDAVAAGESRLTVLESLREGGLKSLAASGSMRVISGDTTVREVMNAVGPAFWSELAGHYGAYFTTEAAESIPMNAAQGFGVLLISEDAALAERLLPSVEEEGLRLVVARDAEVAREMLSKDEDIAFIIGDIPEGTSVESAAALLRENRLHIAWARLPAAVLLPASLAEQQDALRDSGVMAAFFPKPADVPELITQIRRAHAR